MAGKALALARPEAAGGGGAGELSSMCEPCRKKAEVVRDEARACDRPGCDGTWVWKAADQLQAFATGRGAPKRLCDACESRLAALTDQEVPCAVEGCQRKGVFSARDQLLAGAPDQPVSAPATMCGPCAGVYAKIKDRAVPCAVRACRNKWTWGKDAQIQAYAAGLPNEAPKRLCESCQTTFGELAEKPVRCRTSGCKNTWGWSVREQLDAIQPGKPAPKPAHRMCQRCLDTFAKLKDVERPCRRPGCKRTWTDKRGAQLARAVRGKTGDPFPRYCSECERELGDLQDRPVGCKTEGCPGTWTWTREAQLAAGVRPLPALTNGTAASDKTSAGQNVVAQGSAPAVEASAVAGSSDESAAQEGDEGAAEAAAPTNGANRTGPAGAGAGKKRRRRHRRREIHPPERRCEGCVEFLRDRKTLEIPCQQCGTLIFWPPESQLQTKLGHWAQPTQCGACKRDATEAARAAQREALRHPGGEHHGSETPPADGGSPTREQEPAATEDASAPASAAGVEGETAPTTTSPAQTSDTLAPGA